MVKFNEMKSMVRPIEDDAVLANMDQTVMIRNHLLRYGSITPNEAKDLYSISRLADVVYKLRYKKQPYMEIQRELVSGKNKFGKSVRYAKYYI